MMFSSFVLEEPFLLLVAHNSTDLVQLYAVATLALLCKLFLPQRIFKSSKLLFLSDQFQFSWVCLHRLGLNGYVDGGGVVRVYFVQ
jgi:hypothetical protein